MNHTAYIAHTENFMNSMFFMVKKKEYEPYSIYSTYRKLYELYVFYG